MRRISLLPLLLLGAQTVAAPMVAPIEPPLPAPPITLGNAKISPQTPRTFDFIGQNLAEVLRTLARAANINVVVADGVEGTVNMRIQDQTPKEAMEIVIASKDLVYHQSQGVYFIRSKNPPIRISAEEKAAAGLPTFSANGQSTEALSALLLPTLTGFSDAMLDYQGRPETARRIARAKRAYYEALMAQGFTKEQALRIILTNQELSAFDSKK
ncbi:MAG: hypothetical protein ABJF10_11565 [Chthoniobacter sp.]|uniref:hypothetical protein n=1 Tax=Chthoniobacter sp. TaxID=2510640 RepID=UPI0032AA5324